jgi:hypothetical protein
MENNLHNRVTRPVGRPPKTDSPNPEVEAAVVQIPSHIPALICPLCGQGMTPVAVRGARPNGERDCQCSQCGGAFVYRPPTVRIK